MLDVEYTKGGVPVVLVPSDTLRGSGMCGATVDQVGTQANTVTSSAPPLLRPTGVLLNSFLILAILPCMLSILW